MAIKVNGTEVISNSRALNNIASVDATTVAALGAAGVGGSTFGKQFYGLMNDGLRGNGRMSSNGTTKVAHFGDWNYRVSTDGINWTNPGISGFADSQIDIAHHSGTTWVVTGNDSWLWTSNNDLSSITSSYQDTGVTFGSMNAVTSNGSLIVAANQNGYMYSSTNATSWTRSSRLTTENLWNVRYLNGLWVVVGGNSTLFTSTNGTSWTNRSNTGSSFISDVTYGNGTYVAVGASGTYYTSTNGTSWTNRSNTFTDGQSVESIEYAPNAGVFLMCGASGFIGYTDDPTSYVTWPITQRSTSGVWGAHNVHVSSVGGTERGYVTWTGSGNIVYTE